MNGTANPNKILWEKGDFTKIAATMRQSGEAVVNSLPIDQNMRALDLGCGDGTTAVPLALRGAEVLGIDIASNLVEAGRQRAAEMSLSRLSFSEGDAANLSDLDDNSFDLTLTMFGAMFASNPYQVAKEMVRVTKPGGRIVMGNWIPNDTTSFVSQLLKISSSYSPPPPDGFISPMTWGVESHIVERFGAAGITPENISMVKETYTFTTPEQPAEFIDNFRNFYGPTMNAFAAARKNGREQDLLAELLALAHSQNLSTEGGTHISATFLRVTALV